MNNYKLHAPEGTYDILPGEMKMKRQIENVIMNTFSGFGYKEIQTPIFEYMEVFEGNTGSIKQESMFKFFDSDGHILVLRPDMTTPAVRLAATKFSEDKFPLRLSYIGHAFRNNETVYGARLKEFTQAGIELLGVNSALADAEVIAATIEALKSTGLSDFQIEIGQVEFFKGLIECAGIDEKQAEQLRKYIDSKDFLAVSEMVEKLSMPENIKALFSMLPSLFGGSDVLNSVYSQIPDGKAREAVKNLKEVYEKLCDLGYLKYISIDLGMVQSLDYYTGIIFKGFTKHMGFSVCGGGRYDNLSDEFGKPCAGAGVAIGVDRLISALSRQNKEDINVSSDYLISCEEGAEKFAAKVAKDLREQGFVVEQNILNNTSDEALKKGIKNIIMVFKSGKFEIYNLVDGSKKMHE